MSETQFLSLFSDHLFWDCNRSDINLNQHAAFLVQRVLEYGLLSDWVLLRNYMGVERIAAEAKTLRSLEDKALNFICVLSGTHKEDYRCYILKQSNQQPWKEPMPIMLSELTWNDAKQNVIAAVQTVDVE